ncbi:hypothetical protein L1887_09493 [Cichorium endivia]|nr:hypothetical protein L1887_09493 [Cichorium endivia]
MGSDREVDSMEGGSGIRRIIDGKWRQRRTEKHHGWCAAILMEKKGGDLTCPTRRRGIQQIDDLKQGKASRRWSNRGQLRVRLASLMAMSSANGVAAQGLSFLVITCYVKYVPEIQAALFVPEISNYDNSGFGIAGLIREFGIIGLIIRDSSPTGYISITWLIVHIDCIQFSYKLHYTW